MIGAGSIVTKIFQIIQIIGKNLKKRKMVKKNKLNDFL